MQNRHNQDDHSYQGWLNSNSFLKRAFAVWGYSLVAQLIISVVLGLLALLFLVPMVATGIVSQ